MLGFEHWVKVSKFLTILLCVKSISYQACEEVVLSTDKVFVFEGKTKSEIN